jgi:hypothetical protein
MPIALNQICLKAFIVAHREDISLLSDALNSEGFQVQVVRGPYSTGQQSYSAIYRCLVNHANAWRLVAESGVLSLIVEADFVPVLGFGRLPLPVPVDRLHTSLAYLYACGPQFWDLPMSPYCARGHAGGMVSYVVSPAVATMMLEFCEEQCVANPSGAYAPWDAGVGYWLKTRGVESYLPYLQYGEHGGVSNPEHARAGLGRPHQADALAGPLAFLPPYAQGSLITFWRVRLRARVWGWARLLAGRSLTWQDLIRTEPLRMFGFVVGRLMAKPHRHHIQ